MKNTGDLITQIVETIFPNEYEQIDAQKTQDLLKEMTNSLINKSENPLPIKNTFNNANLSNGKLVLDLSTDISDFDISITDNIGVKFIVAGIASQTATNQVTIDLSAISPISGTWKYILKYYL